MKTSEKINLTELYSKAERVLLSSKNDSQLRVSKNYIEFYFIQTNDKSGYDVLIRKYNKLKSELY